MTITINRNTIIGILVLACLVLGVVAVYAMGAASRSSRSALISGEPRYGLEGIRVSGTAVVRGTPDLATTMLGYSNTAKNAKTAKAVNDSMMRKIISAIKHQGIAAKDIKTTEYSIYPAHNEKGRLIGWKVTNEVQIRIHDVDKVSDVLESAINAGANRTEGINYTVESLADLRSQAREQAVKAACKKAEQLAELTGAKVGKVVSITDSSYQNYGWWPYQNNISANSQITIQNESALPEETDSEVSAGRVAVQARVDLVFGVD